MRVTTGARTRDLVEGLVVDADGRPWLALKVRAAAVEGQANAAVLALVAERLGCSKGSITIRRGARSRWKHLAIMGDAPTLEQRCRTMLAEVRPAD